MIMPDFATARRMMVEGQLRTFDITDKDVLAAMLALPREAFIPASSAAIAYLDTEVPVDARGARRLLTPMIFAKMLQVAELAPTHHVLDVGCATGYSSAVLSRLSANVVALEEDPDLAREARQNLAAVAATHVSVVEGPLAKGWAPAAPYDRIIVNGRCDEAPTELFGQLKEEGVLVCVAGPGPATKVMIYRLLDGKISGQPAFDGHAPLLPGFARPLAFQF
jgi:protein-L-isoaspartate(D-aspartate) O-methyltransferase